MRRYSVLIILIVLAFSCKKKGATQEKTSKVVRPTVEPTQDTILNGGIYKARVYFENSSLIDMGRKSGIEQPFYLKYRGGVDGNAFFIADVNQSALVSSDTAYVEFSVKIDTLQQGQTGVFYWYYHAQLDYTTSHAGIDTTFAAMQKVYVRSIKL